MPHETFEHTADLGLRVRAADLDELFAEAARGLFEMIVPELSSVRAAETVEIEVGGEISELLLFDWLNELLYTYETKRLLLCEFDVAVSDSGVKATCRGEPVDPNRHQLDHEVKAITYYGLTLEHTADGWLGEVIVDI
jgi:SHS2 domain-containing protein